MVKITLPDGAQKNYDDGVTGIDIAKSIGAKLARDALAVKVNGIVTDLTEPITQDSSVEILTFDTHEGKEVFFHSASHLMTQAVLRLYGDKIGLGVGPAVSDGFYQDFDIPPIGPDDLPKIEEEMQKIVNQDLKIKKLKVPKSKALKFYEHDPYKTEMIKDLDGDVTMYEQGEYRNLCKGPHVPSTGFIKAFKLMKVAGAYWKGSSDNKMLQRIYGIAFPEKKQLRQYLNRLEEAKKRDHRKIGKEMDLFSMHPQAPGMPFFHDKGTYIFNKLKDYMRCEMLKLGYEFNMTPLVLNKSLWQDSGHWDHYKDNMYFTKIDSGDYAIKPMNCPGNLLVYKSRRHSYRELPIKAGEFGKVHRHELSGVLSGLFRVRVFTQDDAHVFCQKDQLPREIRELLDLVDRVYKTFGFDYHMELSTRPDKAMGDKGLWDEAESILKDALNGKDYKINAGDGAFYGPKIDIHLKDAIGRTWQCGTIQLDFQMPEKFDLTYEDSEGGRSRPVMLHRAIYGSLERFLGILIEHYAGKFPLWLNPNQVKVLPIADRHLGYAHEVSSVLEAAGFRVTVDQKADTASKKVREAQLEHYNYILVVGDNEQGAGTVNVRARSGKVLGEVSLSDFKSQLLSEVKNKK